MPLAPAATRAPRRLGETRRSEHTDRTETERTAHNDQIVRSRPSNSTTTATTATVQSKAQPKARSAIDPHVAELWRQYKHQPSRDCRDQLIEYYMPRHVRRIAERMHSSLPKQVDIDDLIQQGYLGLVESIERFDPQRNVKFETFSGRRIFGSMRDYLRAIDPMPRLSRIREKKIQSVTERFRKEFGRDPGDEELREQLDVPEPRFRRMMGGDRAPMMVHFNSARSDSDDMEDSDGMRTFEDRRLTTPHIRAEHKDLRQWISEGFCRRDRLIITLYYYERMTMKEIGTALGISESRVSQRLDSILKCLRSRLCHLQTAEQEFYFRK